MSTKKQHRTKHPSTSAPKPANGKRIIGSGIALMFVLLIVVRMFMHQERTTAPRTSTRDMPQAASSPAEELKTTIDRAYAVDRLFHQVINPEWEGASGAIGDAHLYAATSDAGLLRFYSQTFPLLNMHNGTWVDDRAWVCLAELHWWNVTGRMYSDWVSDAKRRYAEAKQEGRLSKHEGFWSWYNYSPSAKQEGMQIFTNTNMNQMVTVACMLYEATHEIQFLKDALLVWEGDGTVPGIEKQFYHGHGMWEGKEGQAAFGKQFPWEGAGMCTIGAALYRATGKEKYREIVVATAKRIMDPGTGWIDPTDFYQLRMDGNGAFVYFLLDAYQIAPAALADIPQKIQKMLDHVWTNHHGTASLTLHRMTDDGIRNGWNPNGGEDGYKVDEIGTVHAQAQAVLAFGTFASVLHHDIAARRP